ncbi:MAG: hypothetical protein KIT20_11260 [Alphaproteobacteria bacterium]|nr:hypothetical protein [Alphaproteobacteria bacterium]
MRGRIPSARLAQCGFELLRSTGRRFVAAGRRNRRAICYLDRGESCLIRTSNDRLLISGARPGELAGLDFLLLVMPAEARRFGEVEGYLLPARLAEHALQAVRAGRRAPWKLHFDRRLEPGHGYALIWAEHRLPASIWLDPAGLAADTTRERALSA